MVSIHAPVKGATAAPSPSATTECFNPRAREGRDLPPRLPHPHRLVSIHAPVKGATFNGRVRMNLEKFQSTRP